MFENPLFTLGIAFFGGALSALAPCSLYILPLTLSFEENNTLYKRAKITIAFAFGTVVTFIGTGFLFLKLGIIISISSRWMYLLLSIFLILSSLQWMDIIHFIPNLSFKFKKKSHNLIGYFMLGLGMGAFSSPCATPILAALYSYVTNIQDVTYGMLLLLLFSTGYGLVIIIFGTFVGLIKTIRYNKTVGLFNILLKYIFGIVILVFGYYMFYLGI